MRNIKILACPQKASMNWYPVPKVSYSILILIFLYFLAETIIYNAAGCKHAGRFSAQTQ